MIPKKWECCEACNRMYQSGESCVDCPGFVEPINTYLARPEQEEALCTLCGNHVKGAVKSDFLVCKSCVDYEQMMANGEATDA